MKKFLLFFVSLSFVFAAKPITAKDIINLEYISQPVINIGGTRIAYVKIVPPSKNSKSRSSFREVWVTDVDGLNQRKFTSTPNNSWSPQWTPDGNLSFLSLTELRTEEPASTVPEYILKKVREPTNGSFIILKAKAANGSSSELFLTIEFSSFLYSIPLIASTSNGDGR